MLNEKFYREIRKNMPALLYFLWGNESFLLEEVLQKTLETVISEQQKDFNFNVFYPSSTPQEITDTASTFPFLSERRLVVLKDFNKFTAANIKNLNHYLNRPCKTTCLIAVSNKAPKSTLQGKWSVINLRVRESDIPLWLSRRAGDRGIKLSKDAIESLIESTGPDMGLLSAEIEKLALSGLKTIEEKDIADLIGAMRQYTAFNLIDALVAGDKTKSFRILRSLLDSKSSDAASVLAPLNWHFREFYKLWESKGKRPVKMKNTTYKTLLNYLPSFKQEDFYEIFQDLHYADIGIKSSGKPELVLEVLLIKLLQVGSGN